MIGDPRAEVIAKGVQMALADKDSDNVRLYVNLVKRVIRIIRIIGYVFLVTSEIHALVLAGIVLIVAEILKILEELI